MAPNHDEQMNMRRERREALRRKQEAERKRMRIGLILAAVVLVVCGVGLIRMTRGANAAAAQASIQVETTEATEAPTEETTGIRGLQSPTTIHIKAAGDLNITNSVVSAGLAATGYDYTRAFMDVAAVLSDADLTVLNFEGNVSGEPYGSDTTSAPAEILEGLRHAGVDLVQTANSRSIQNGLIGLTSTLRAIKNSGIAPVGSFS